MLGLPFGLTVDNIAELFSLRHGFLAEMVGHNDCVGRTSGHLMNAMDFSYLYSSSALFGTNTILRHIPPWSWTWS